MSLEGAIAAHRFGLGARPGEIDIASAGAKAWLLHQLDGAVPQPGMAALPSTGAEMAQLMALYQQNKEARTTGDAANAIKVFAKAREMFLTEMAARFILGFTTDKPFVERLVWFWSNHLSVSGQNPRTLAFIGAYERDAIRPHILGKFEDLLLASARHPAMLIYLNNAESIGPHSLAGLRTQRGLNENYGRELMELHTLGVDGGYTQAEVISLAKLLTGWSVDRQATEGDSAFRFFPPRHEPGPVTLLGKTYPPTEEGGIAAIRDLARHPKTAQHIAQKFARHFIAENPSSDSTDRLAKVFARTGGDLRALTIAAVEDPAGWTPRLNRIRPPMEYITAAARALNWPKAATTIAGDGKAGAGAVRNVMNAAKNMGQFPFTAPAPTGWDDRSEAWSGPDAVLTRVEWASNLANHVPRIYDPVVIAEASLGPLLSSDTRTAIQHASSGPQGLALVLASPEFQRR
jgi:uncharacterized protein (DUF1800 family)